MLQYTRGSFANSNKISQCTRWNFVSLTVPEEAHLQICFIEDEQATRDSKTMVHMSKYDIYKGGNVFWSGNSAAESNKEHPV